MIPYRLVQSAAILLGVACWGCLLNGWTAAAVVLGVITLLLLLRLRLER